MGGLGKVGEREQMVRGNVVTEGGDTMFAEQEYTLSAGRDFNMFGSAAERAKSATVHRNSSARCDAVGRGRSLRRVVLRTGYEKAAGAAKSRLPPSLSPHI